MFRNALISRARLNAAAVRAGVSCIMAVIFAFAPETLRAQPEVSKEYQIKAACLFNFARFVEWPPTAFTNADAPLCIGILGDDPFGQSLDKTLKDETVHNHRLLVVRSKHVEDLKTCQLVFISRSEKGHVTEILDVLKTGTLTVSETEDFARRGGDINFFLEGNKVRFEINPAVAQSQGLKISSQLLSLGKIVAQEEGR